jgi:hypothetical protein
MPVHKPVGEPQRTARDGAVELMKANRQLSNVKMAKLLKDAGFEHRSKEWVRLKRGELRLGGVKTGNGP